MSVVRLAMPISALLIGGEADCGSGFWVRGSACAGRMAYAGGEHRPHREGEGDLKTG